MYLLTCPDREKHKYLNSWSELLYDFVYASKKFLKSQKVALLLVSAMTYGSLFTPYTKKNLPVL